MGTRTASAQRWACCTTSFLASDPILGQKVGTTAAGLRKTPIRAPRRSSVCSGEASTSFFGRLPNAGCDEGAIPTSPQKGHCAGGVFTTRNETHDTNHAGGNGTLLCRAVGSFGNAGVAPFASERKPSRTIKKLARVEEKTSKNKLASLAKRKPSRRIKKK